VERNRPAVTKEEGRGRSDKIFLPKPHPFMGGAFTGSQTVYHRRRSEVVQSQEIDRGILTHRIRRDAK